jgi:hypothetical protein
MRDMPVALEFIVTVRNIATIELRFLARSLKA